MSGATKPAWTPGPWSVEPDEFGAWDILDSDRSEFVVEGVDTVDSARLIAAAPDYAEAADPLVHYIDQWSDLDDDAAVEVSLGDLRALAAADRKARGEA